MITQPTNEYLTRERLTDLAQFAVPDGHDLWPRIEKAARTSASGTTTPRPGFLSLGFSRAWTAVGVLFIAATFAALGFGLAVLVFSNGHDQVPAAPVTPTPTSNSVQQAQVLPSNIEGYTRLVEQDPANLESIVEENIETLNEYITTDITDPHNYVERGAAYVTLYAYRTDSLNRAESFLEQAVADFTAAIELDPFNAGAYIGRGEAYDHWQQRDRAVQEYGMAIKHLTESISLDSQNVKALLERAYAYQHLGEIDKSIQDLDSAIGLEPDNPWTYQSRAGLNLQRGEIDSAIRDLDTAIRLDPSLTYSYSSRGGSYAQSGDYDKALMDYDMAVSLNPNFRWAYGNRGNVYSELGDYERAIQDYGRAIAIRPYSAAYINRGIAYYHLGEYDNAIQDYSSAIDRFPDYPQTYVDRGDAYYMKGEFDRAIEDYERAISLEANIPGAYYGRGLTHASLGNVSKAQTDLNKALSLGHDSGEVEAALKELDDSADPASTATPPATPNSWVSENGFIQFTTGDDPLDDPLPGTHQWCIHPSNAPKEPAGPWLVPSKLPEGMEQTIRDQMFQLTLFRAFRSSTDRISMWQGLCATRKLNPAMYRAIQVGDRTAYVTAGRGQPAGGSAPTFDPNDASSLIMDIGHGTVEFSVFGSVTVDELVAMAASLVPEELSEAEQGPYPQAVLDALGTGFGPVYVPSKLPDGYEVLGQLQARQEALEPITSRQSYARAVDGLCAFRLSQAAFRRQFPDVVQRAQRGDETTYTTTDESGQAVSATAKWGTVELDGVTIYAQEFSAQPRNEYTDVYFQSQEVWFNLTISTTPYCEHSLEMVAEIASSLGPLQP